MMTAGLWQMFMKREVFCLSWEKAFVLDMGKTVLVKAYDVQVLSVKSLAKGKEQRNG
jgi:hypothetical protein